MNACRRLRAEVRVQAKNIIEVIGTLLDFAGVIVIAVGTLIASATFGLRFLRMRCPEDSGQWT
jgi:hypothetical protein